MFILSNAVLLPLVGALVVGFVLGAFFCWMLSDRSADAPATSISPEPELLWQQVGSFAAGQIRYDRQMDESLQHLIAAMATSTDPAIRDNVLPILSAASELSPKLRTFALSTLSEMIERSPGTQSYEDLLSSIR